MADSEKVPEKIKEFGKKYGEKIGVFIEKHQPLLFRKGKKGEPYRPLYTIKN